MNELIPVNHNRQTTSARQLWQFLGRPYEQFNKWFDKYKEYGFAENLDYRALSTKILTAQGNCVDAKDYEITVDMAKELCMLQKTEKGSQARKYFIEVEKAWNSPEMIMKRALEIANDKVKALEGKVEQDKPKVEFADHVATSTNSLLVREVAKIISKQGIEIGEQRLYKKLRDWGWVFKNSCEAKQRAIESGYMEVAETVKETSKGKFTFKTSRVTGKGQIRIMEKLKEE